MTEQQLAELAKRIRYSILISTSAAGSGHLTSSLSAVELVVTLFFKYLAFDPRHPRDLANDHFILSKGHASPIYYALYAAAGLVTEAELKTLRKIDSPLEGHPSIKFPFTEVPTGSLGQGLSFGVGVALGLRNKYQELFHGSAGSGGILTSSVSRPTPQDDKLPTVYVLLGDGEMAEGQNWEAIEYAAYQKLTNLVAIVDVNRLGQSQQTLLGYDMKSYAQRIAGFGWRTIVVENGHDLGLLDKAYTLAHEQLKTGETPVAIIAKTIKGKGVSFLEDKNGWHGVALKPDELTKALSELGTIDMHIKGQLQKPTLLHQDHQQYILKPTKNVGFTVYKKKTPVATRKAYGMGLVRLGKKYANVVVLDGDMKNSTYAKLFADAFPNKFFESFIAEQNMVSMAVGFAHVGFQPFVSTFGAFFTRTFDQLRMAALSSCNLVMCGSHAGVSIGEDGPSQMGLADLAMFRSLPDSTVLYPSDAVMTERLVELAYNQFGITYIRTARPETPILYGDAEEFTIGGSKVFNSQVSSLSSHKKEITIVAAGITVFEALKSQEKLAQEGISTRVIDCYSVKPIDSKTLIKAASETQGIITVEDHYPVGGLGDAVLEALAGLNHPPIYKLAVYKAPRSGKSQELLAYENISRAAIVDKVYKIQESFLG